jgi:hypothetical protein
MHKCTHNAAGGTIHRLNPGLAIVRLRARKPKAPTESVWTVESIVPSRQLLFLYVAAMLACRSSVIVLSR